MNDQNLCDCRVECPGRASCELGTWVQPDSDGSRAQAREALVNLGGWLSSEDHTTREIVAALFESVPLVEDPTQIDLLFGFFEAMKELGYQNSDEKSYNGIWSCNQKPPSEHKWIIPGINGPIQGKPLGLKNIACNEKPAYFDRVIEFMAELNFDWLNSHCYHTLELLDMFFPGASNESLASWLIQAFDDSLYRIGYTPIASGEDENRLGAFDNPIWFCDGYTVDMLHHNLWMGEPSKG